MVSEKIVAKGKKLAAHILEAAEDDIEFKDGRFTIAGTDRGLGIHEVAKSAFQLEKLPPGMEPGLYETATYRARSGNFPNGCHVCEVEIDPETGATGMVGYWVVDDVGTVINPLLVKGQIMGGIATARCSWRIRRMTPRARCSPVRSWTTPCRVRRTSATW